MWPHTQPVTAPNAPVSEERRNRTAPSRPHCGCMLIVWSTCRARLGVGASSGGGGGVVLRRTDPMVASSWWCSSTTASWAAASRRSRNGPSSAASRGARALLDDATGLEDGDLLGALGGGEPVGDEDAGAPRDQPVGGAYDAGLGDRVHAGRGLVEDDDADVAHQEPGERDELLLAGGQAGAAGAEDGVEAVGQPGDPLGQAELGHRRLDDRARDVVEEGDVVGEGAGEDLGALGDHADGGAQLLQVEVEDVGAAEEHRAARRLDGTGEQGGQGGLARPGATDEGAGVAGR